MTLSLGEYLNVSRAVPAEVMAEPSQDNALSLSRTHRHIYKYICICLPLALLYFFCIQVLICIDGPIRNNALSEVLIVIYIYKLLVVLLQYLTSRFCFNISIMSQWIHLSVQLFCWLTLAWSRTSLQKIWLPK